MDQPTITQGNVSISNSAAVVIMITLAILLSLFTFLIRDVCIYLKTESAYISTQTRLLEIQIQFETKELNEQ